MSHRLMLIDNAVIVTLFFLICSAHAVYSPTSSVKVLDRLAFQKTVKNGQSVHLVEFFAPWCGHCKTFAPEYEKAARALKGIVNVVAVEDQDVVSSEGVQGFPTIKLFVGKGESSISYDQARTADAVVDFVLKQVGRIAKERLGGGKSKSKSSKKSSSSNVIVNFDSVVMNDTNAWFVEIFAPWCGHCKALEPKWEAVATQLKGKVKVGKIDGTVNTVLAKRFSIKGFPTLKLFPGGTKTISSAISYDGPRETADMASYALDHAGSNTESEQLLSDDQFKEECQKVVCVLAILPDLLDSMAEGRNGYLKEYNKVVRSTGSTPIKFFWVEGGKNLDFEESLHLQFGYPAVVAVHLEKKKFSVFKGNFSVEAMKSFLVSLMAGRATLSNIPTQLPQLSSTLKWDGKDAVPLASDDNDDNDAETQTQKNDEL